MNLREQLNQISIKHSIPSYQTGGVSENKWEIEDVSKNLLPQKQLKVPEINYLKDWLNSPMAVKIAKTRDPINAQQNINSRLERLSDNNLDIKTVDEVNQKGNSFDKRRVKGFDNPNLQGVSYYSPAHNFGGIFTRSSVPENIFVHEGAHASTAGNTLLFKNDVSDILSRVKDDSGKYYSNPTEVQARLNVLRKELKESGIVDPFKTPVTKQQLKTFLNKYKRPTDKTNKPLLEANSAELMNTVKSEDDVLWMLNNIVSNQNNELIPISQNGGLIYYPNIEKGVSPSDRNGFLTALNFENKYITSPKFKERVEKAGYNFQDYVSNMKGVLKNISLIVDDSKINANGAYYRPDTNEVAISTKPLPSILKKSDVFSHEIGHGFQNENLKKFIDDRNILVPTDPIERKKMEEKLKDQNYYNGDGHEQEDREMAADVHSARYELYKYGIDNKSKNIYDGRYSNFTNSAYNDMLKIAKSNPFSASARLLNKVGSRKFEKEWDKVTSEVKTINSDAEQEWYDETLNKIDEKAKKLNKQYIFEIMNRIVQNNNLNNIKYAQEGGIIKIIDRNGNLIKLNKDSDQYRNLYNNKLIQGYDPKTDTYYLTPTKEKVVYNNTAKTSGEIPEIVLKGKKADWVKYKEDYIKNNPKEKYIQEYLDAYPWAHQSLTNYPKRLDESYENMVNNYIGEQIVKNKPQGNKSREDWLNSMTEQEQRFVQRNPKYGTTLWQDTIEGGKALFNLGNDLQISRIEQSNNYTNLEKKDLIEEHNKNPILSNISDITQVLSPLTVPSKMVQSVYRPEYSIKDAIYGTKNKAGMLEDIATDPLNLAGAEFFNKFDDINKIVKPLNSLEGINKINQIGKEKNLILEASQFKEDLPFLDNIKNFFRKEEGVPLKIKQNISDYKTRVIYDNQDIPEGYVKFNQLKVDDLSKIQKDSYVQLGSTLKSLYKNEGKGIRTSADIFYNPSKGFIVKPVNGIEHILNTDSEILNHLDKVTNGNSRVIKSIPYTENELSTINNKAQLSLDSHRFFSNTLAKDDKYLKNAGHYSKNKISPLEIIKQNDNKYQEAKTFLQNRVNEIHDEYDLDKLKKIAYYKSENPTINDVLNVKNKVLENIEKSISKNGNKHVRDVLINKINNSPYDELSEVVRDIDLNTTIKNAQAITPKTAYASVDEGVPYMFIKPNIDDTMAIPHEFGHNIQRSLGIKDITNLDKDIIKELEVNGTDHFKKLTDPYILREYGNGRRSEPAAFFSEVKEDMRNKGFIKSRFDGIKPEVFDNYLKTKNKPELTGYMKKEPLFNLLNKYYSTIPIAGGIGYEALNSEDETPKYQDGGNLNNIRNILNNMYNKYE